MNRVYLNVLVDLVLSAFVLLWLKSVYIKLCFRLFYICLSIVSESITITIITIIII